MIKKISNQLNELQRYYYLLLLPSILIYLARSIRYIKTPFQSSDAEQVYLPLARKLLQTGPSLFFEKASLATSPGTYIWPAIFHANPTSIRIASMILGIFILLFIYQIGKELHSQLAGLIASFLFAISPTLIVWIPSLLSEPTYIFFSIIFLWSLIKIAKGHKWAVFTAALSLTISIFIRPVWLYPAILFLAFFFLFARLLKNQKQVFNCFSIAFLLGLLLPLAFITRNQIQYKLPSISVGTGAVLLYGTNPFTGGFEPPLMNLSYGLGIQNNPELDGPQNFILRNQKLMDVSKAQLKNMTLKEFTTFIVKKVSWFMFFTPLESSYKAAFLRAIEIALSLFTFIWGLKNRNYLIILIASIVAIQIGQSTLALYNIRYSSGNLEPLIIILSAVGAALLIKEFLGDFVKFCKDFFLCLTLTVLGIFLHYNVLPKTYYPSSIPFHTLFEKNIENTANEHIVELDIEKLSPIMAANTFIKINFSSKTKLIDCKNNFIYFKSSFTHRNNIKQPVDFREINDKSELFIGAISPSLEGLFKESGKLVIETGCQLNGQVSIPKISIIESNLDKFWK